MPNQSQSEANVNNTTNEGNEEEVDDEQAARTLAIEGTDYKGTPADEDEQAQPADSEEPKRKKKEKPQKPTAFVVDFPVEGVPGDKVRLISTSLPLNDLRELRDEGERLARERAQPSSALTIVEESATGRIVEVADDGSGSVEDGDDS